MRGSLSTLFPALLAIALPLLMGAGEGCGGAAVSPSEAPDVTGAWNIAFDDRLDIEVTVGGSVYKQVLGAGGGKFKVMHQGKAVEFNLDCSRTEVVCPSEAWPRKVTISQRNTELEHQMVVTLLGQKCGGQLVDPPMSACGPGTNNPNCDQICDGAITNTSSERFGVISEDGGSFDLLLGAAAASNGVNCLLLALSTVKAKLVNTGSAATGDWKAKSMTAGEASTAYAGGCLWAGDVNMDKELEALVLAGRVKLTNGFTAARQ